MPFTDMPQQKERQQDAPEDLALQSMGREAKNLHRHSGHGREHADIGATVHLPHATDG